MAAKRKAVQRGVIGRWPKTRAIAEQRYNEFVRPFLSGLHGMAKRISKGDAHLFDEMIAETTIKIISSSEVFDRSREIKPFVMTVANNAMLDVLKREKPYKKHIKLEPFEKLLPIIDSKQKILLGQASKQKGQPPKIRRWQIVKKVNNLLELSNLGKKRKDVFRYQTGISDGRIKTYGETAEHFGIPIGTVKSIIYYVRKDLKRLVALSYKQRRKLRKAKK